MPRSNRSIYDLEYPLKVYVDNEPYTVEDAEVFSDILDGCLYDLSSCPRIEDANGNLIHPIVKTMLFSVEQ